MKLRKKTLFHLFLIGLSVYQLIWVFIGAYYSYPNAEDLSVAVLARDKGIFAGAIHLLQTFDGRYTVNILHGLNPLAFDAYYANKGMAVFTILICWFSVFHYLNIRFNKKKKSINLLYALVFTLLFFSILDLSKSLYWMICSFVYIYPLILFLNFYSFFLKYKDSLKNSDYAISTLFLFLAVGCCELYIPLFGVFLLLLYFQYKAKSTERKILFWYLVIFLFSSLLFVTSPGIINRYTQFEEDRIMSLTELILIALKYLWMSLKSLNYIPLFIFILLFNLEYKIPKRKISSFWILIISFAFALLLWIVVLFLMGNGFPARILPVFVALFIFTFLKMSSNLSVLSNKKILAVSFIVLTIILPNSYTSIRNDYQFGKLKTFKQEMDKQYLLLTSNENKECLELITLKDIRAILPLSIATNPYIKPNREENYWNRAYEKYFHVDEIRLDIDTNKKTLNKTYEILY